jgi:hypothetical protein
VANIADGTGGKPIADSSQSILGLSAVNPDLLSFYVIHGRKDEVLFFCSVLDTTGDGNLLALLKLRNKIHLY